MLNGTVPGALLAQLKATAEQMFPQMIGTSLDTMSAQS